MGPLAVTCDLFSLSPDRTWWRAPTERSLRLYNAGRRTHSVIAAGAQPRATTNVVMMDLSLSPAALWIQWIAVEGDALHPGSYKTRGTAAAFHLRIVDGEVLETWRCTYSPRRTSHRLRLLGEFEGDEGDVGGDNRSDPLPESSVFSARPPAGAPGPPPPRPVNRTVLLPSRHDAPAFNLGQEKVAMR